MPDGVSCVLSAPKQALAEDGGTQCAQRSAVYLPSRKGRPAC